MTKQTTTHHKVAIIGTGFSGLGMAIQLKQSGEEDFIVFEKEAGVGGTWRVNHYPGCACDVPSHLYSFSFAQNPNWTRMFAPQKEIKAYLEYCADTYDIMPHIKLKTALSSARWDNKNNRWTLQDNQGVEYTADVLIAGAGGLSIPSYPSVEGLNKFKGKTFHSQDWDHDYDLKGKRVAVIGTGASAIQFVPHVQQQARSLSLYQRTPPWILPKPDRAISKIEQKLFKRIPKAQQVFRDGLYWLYESRAVGFSFDPRLMSLAKYWALKHIRSQISDPELRKKVTPDYTVGCKRILMSDDYYQALDQDNTEVITTGIKKVTANSIVRDDGKEQKIDAIIFGTGFKASDPIPRGFLFGRNGQDINDAWPQGPEAYKGTTVAGFPNLFILMGPNTGLGHNSMVYMIESQIAYVKSALKFMGTQKIPFVDVSADKQREFNDKIQNKLTDTVWSSGGCQSWYIHPESGRNVTLWPGFTWQFRLQTRHFDASAYYTNPLYNQYSSKRLTPSKKSRSTMQSTEATA
ncbi:flavin-containing monooxygenase [Alkalimarinus sediminis]|uniref:NAD(P)/FAD-dependent oxidoreductase n=1 Tax=Alkalimarinus sediminis TaxID=1632866 RepID=A0A9E8HKV4_9ALTE|nr:NAD(P)/FAD-dependent oxidoreductase [Alkalimarinus sediminis]UZW75207.1 NAD(P)/FAD-dependent oxidoreductase [Alkalimarinus sediminis]